MNWAVFSWRSIAGLAVVSVLALSQGAIAGPVAGSLWYNGDYDGRDAVLNQTGFQDGRVYDNFIVPNGFTYTITGAYSNDFMRGVAPATMAWEIRTGVSAGNGGTLVASGDGAASRVATGRTDVFGGVFIYREFTVQVGVPSVVLGPGSYWLTAIPDVGDDSTNAHGSLISTTSGASAVGSPAGNDDNSFFSSTFFGANFAAMTDIEGDGTWDFSMGVIGTSAQIVPEPSSMALLFGPAFLIAGAYYRRRRQAMVVTAV